MATVYGMLGQLAPSATTLSTVYTVPASKHVTARVLVCNRGTLGSFRIAVSPAGASIDNKHYIAYDQAIAANDAVSSVPFTAAATDVVRVYASSANMSFSVTGIEADDA